MNRLIKGILILVTPVLLLAGIIIFIDPYFHFHKPIKGISYILEDERYQNDGILRNFDYDTILIGTSIDENSKTTDVEAFFGGRAVKVPFTGGYFSELSFTLDNALKRKPVKRVIMSLGYSSFTDVKYDDWGHPEFNYPMYLYDDNIINDIKYVLDINALYMALRDIRRTVIGKKPTSFDEYKNWEDGATFGKNSVLKKYYKDKTEVKLASKETVKKNIRENLVKIVNKYPDTEFDFYLPPFSMIFWYGMKENNALYSKISSIRTVIEELVPCKNVQLFSFLNEWDIVTNFDNYKDFVHYSGRINTFILKNIKNKENLLTKENYIEYLKLTERFYVNYDYEKLFN